MTRVCGVLLAAAALVVGSASVADAADGSKGLEAKQIGGPEPAQLLGPLSKRALFVTTAPGTPKLWVTSARGRGSKPIRVFQRGGAQIFGEYDPYDPYAPAKGDPFVFVADDGVHGVEWWSTDGTPEGTRILVDGMPGAASGVDRYDTPVDLGDMTIIPVQDPEHGREWWRTDGTPEGTELIEDVNPGAGWSNGPFTSVDRVAVGPYMYWPTQDPKDREFRVLWRSDGTEEGTFSLGVRLGWGRFQGGGFEGQIVFGESQGHLFPELWSSDGTPEGTKPYHSFGDSQYSTGQYGTTTADGRLYLSRRNVLYAIDSLDSPPLTLLDNGAIGIGPDFGTPVGRSLIFDVLHGPFPFRSTTFITGGTPETTRPLTSILPPSANPYTLRTSGKRALFASRRGTTIFSTRGTKRSLRRIPVASGQRLGSFGTTMEAEKSAYFVGNPGKGKTARLWRISR